MHANLIHSSGGNKKIYTISNSSKLIKKNIYRYTICMGNQFTPEQTGLERRNGSQAPPAKKKYINQSAKTTSRIIKLRYTEYLYKVHGGPIHPSTAKYSSIQKIIKKVHGGPIHPSTVKKIKN